MMYNRYIPQSNGVYKRHSIEIPEQRAEPVSKPKEEKTNSEPCAPKTSAPTIHGNWDLGDLLLLCIAVLLLLESDEEDILPILIAIVAFIFMQ